MCSTELVNNFERKQTNREKKEKNEKETKEKNKTIENISDYLFVFQFSAITTTVQLPKMCTAYKNVNTFFSACNCLILNIFCSADSAKISSLQIR